MPWEFVGATVKEVVVKYVDYSLQKSINLDDLSRQWKLEADMAELNDEVDKAMGRRK